MKKPKKPAKKPKNPIKKAYIQEWGTYSNDTLVCVGMNYQDILSRLKKIKAKALIVKNFEKSKETIEQRITGEKNTGFVYWDAETNITLLWFPDWKNDWEHWGCLVHEISHLINFWGNQKSMGHEDEAKAYQFEYLFKEIRRKLWKLYP